MVSDRDSILLKRISDKELRKKMTALLDYFADKFSEARVKEKEIAEEIAAVRKR